MNKIGLKNKKAQDLSIATLILIVLGIIVLVLLVLGFSMGWGNLLDKINIFGGGSSLGDIVTACNLPTISQQAYCYEFNKVKVSGKTEYVNCEDSRIVSQITERRTDCDSVQIDNAQIAKCGSLKKNDATQVGEESCADILAAASQQNSQRSCGPSEATRVQECRAINNDRALCQSVGCTWTEGAADDKCGGSPVNCQGLNEVNCRLYPNYCALV